jgi:hypothetical protein
MRNKNYNREGRFEIQLHVLLYGDSAWPAAFREVKSGAEKYEGYTKKFHFNHHSF